MMSVHTLDLLFPYFVFAYGALVTLVLNIPFLVELAEHRLPSELGRQLLAHRWLALVCLVVGALWSLQNLWFKDVF